MNTAVAVNEAIRTSEMKEFKFRFKKDAELGTQRQPVTLMAPVPNAEGFAQILMQGGKGYELLQEAAADIVRDVLADMVASQLDISQENLDVSKLTWDAIANMPKEDRRSIAKEAWDAFVKDYIAVMPGLTGKTEEQVKNATEVFVRKFAPWKTQHNILKKLKEQLALYSNTPNAEQHAEILEFLNRRVDTYLASNDLQAIASAL